jgi:hypothetical protein
MTIVPQKTSFVGLLPCLFLIVSAAGCLSPSKKVDKYYQQVQAQWQSNVVAQRSLPTTNLDWSASVQLMEERNIKLRRARNDLTNAHENVRQVYKDLLPTLNLRSGVSRSIRQLSATAVDDVTFSVDSFLNIPGIVNMSTRLFAAKLALLRAQTVYQLSWREQVLELYKTVLDVQDRREIGAQLEAERDFAQAVQRADPISGDALARDISGRLLTFQRDDEVQQAKISDLLGGREWRWNLLTNDMPAFAYDAEPLPLDDTNRVAQLQMRLVAIEIVGEWAREVGIKLQYWPEVNFFVTGPALYSRVNGQTQTWKPDDIVLRGDFYWRLDTRGYVSRQLKQARREQELALTQIQQDSLTLINKLLAAQKMIALTRGQLDQLHRVIPLLQGAPLPADFAGILSVLELYRNLREQERKMRRDLAELNGVMWFVDEAKWGSPAIHL